VRIDAEYFDHFTWKMFAAQVNSIISLCAALIASSFVKNSIGDLPRAVVAIDDQLPIASGLTIAKRVDGLVNSR
jgi:hypothetical protein